LITGILEGRQPKSSKVGEDAQEEEEKSNTLSILQKDPFQSL
jgi:hypothetical protein